MLMHEYTITNCIYIVIRNSSIETRAYATDKALSYRMLHNVSEGVISGVLCFGGSSRSGAHVL